MKNNQAPKIEHYLQKVKVVQERITKALHKNEAEIVIDLIDNRGRLIKIIELIAKKEKQKDQQFMDLISNAYKNIQEFNHETFPKLELLKQNISQQIAQSYKNKVSLRGYKSTSVRP
jgi:hypothetical protein